MLTVSGGHIRNHQLVSWTGYKTSLQTLCNTCIKENHNLKSKLSPKLSDDENVRHVNITNSVVPELTTRDKEYGWWSLLNSSISWLDMNRHIMSSTANQPHCRQWIHVYSILYHQCKMSLCENQWKYSMQYSTPGIHELNQPYLTDTLFYKELYTKVCMKLQNDIFYKSTGISPQRK